MVPRILIPRLQLTAKVRRCLTVAVLSIVTALGCCAQMVTLDKAEYRSTYDLRLQVPRQVEWTISPKDLGTASRQAGWQFRQDLPYRQAVANHADYNGSGYDRGHLCPASDRSCTLSAMKATFSMSNIAPQVPSLNRGAWKQSEDFCRRAVARFGTISVVVVPLFLNRDTTFIGRHRLAVPHAFVKCAWVASTDSIIGTWFYFNY